MKDDREHNLTTGFALPLLGWRKSMYMPYLVDAYIYHQEVERFREGHVFVLLKWSDTEDFDLVCKALSESKLCASEYVPDKDGSLVMFIMKVPNSLMPDYELFLEGKYSKMSEKAQELIREDAKPGGKVIRILNRDSHYKEDIESRVGTILPFDVEVHSSIQDEYLLKKQVFTSKEVSKIVLQLN